ncbi:MAG TPA: FHA domain-containing protein [Tepidisphaeraceae bacterium]
MAQSSKSLTGAAQLIPLGSHAEAPPIVLKRPVTLIGSRQDVVRLHLNSSSVSKAHCVIVLNTWGCYIHDLGSRTKTWVNGQEVIDANLEDGDLIQVGRFKFRYIAPAGASGIPTPAPAAELKVSTLSDPLPLIKRVIQIGRRVGGDLQFDDPAVSNIHAILFEHNGARYVRDISSRSGTWLDGTPIHQEALDDGAVLKIGSALLTLTETTAAAGANASDTDFADDLGLELEPPQIEAPRAAARPSRAAPPVPIPPVSIPLELDDVPEPAVEGTAVEAETPAASGHDAIGLADSLTDAPVEAPKREESLELAPAEGDDALADLRRGWRASPHNDDSAEAPLALTPPAPELPAVVSPPIEPAAPLPADAAADEAPLPLADLVSEITAAKAEAKAPEPSIAELAESTNACDEADDDLLVDFSPLAPAADDEADADEVPVSPTIDLSPEIELSPIAPELAINADVAKAAADAPPAVDDAVIEPLEEIEENDVQDVFLDSAPLAESLNAPAIAPEPTPGVISSADRAADSTDPLQIEDDEDLIPDAVSEATFPDEDEDRTIDAPVLESAEALDEPAVVPEEQSSEIDLTTAEVHVAAQPTTDANAALPAAPADEALPALEAAAEAHAEIVAELPAAPASSTEPDIEPAVPLLDLPEDDEEEELSGFPLAVDDGDTALEAWVEDDAEEVAEAPVVTTNEPAEEVPVVPPAGNTAVAPAKDEVGEFDLDDLEEDESAQLRAAGVTSSVEPPLTVPADHPADDDADGVLDLEGLDEADEAKPSLEVMGSSESASVVVEPPTVDLSGTQFDAEVVADEAEEPEPIGDLAAIDFSHLSLDATSRTDSIIEAAEVVDATTPQVPSGLQPFDLEEPDSKPKLIEIPPAAEAAGSADNYFIEAEVDEEPTVEEVRFEALLDDLQSDDPAVAAAAADALRTGEPDDEAFVEDDELLDDRRDRPRGSLSDLIPTEGPLMGGAFLPEPQQFMVGGSPIVDLSQPLAPQNPANDSPRRENEPRRPRRTGFGNQPVPQSPFASGNPSDGQGNRPASDVLIGRRGGQSVDVFSNPSPTAEELLLDRDESARQSADDNDNDIAPAPARVPLKPEEQEILDTADRFRPRGSIRAVSDPAASVQLPATGAAPQDPADAAALRHQRLRRVLFLTLLMVPLIGAAVYAVHHYLPVTSNIDASISFRGLDRLSSKNLTDFRSIQNEVVQSEQTRQAAVALLPKNVSEGFLDDVTQLYEALDRNPEVRWPSNLTSTLRLRVRSTDEAGDRERLRALAQAVVKANGVRSERHNQLQNELAELQAKVQTLNVRRSALNDELQALQQIGETRPDANSLEALSTRLKAAEAARHTAVARRQDKEVEIERLKQATPGSTVAVPEEELLKNDEELASLTQKLRTLEKEIAANRSETTSRSSAARKEMDDQIVLLQQQLASAEKMGKNPELEAFVEAATRISQFIRRVTDDLIQRQERSYLRLSELKTKMAADAETHTRDMLLRDPELKKLQDRYAMLSRQVNAGRTEGFDTSKIQLDMNMTNKLIEAREELLSGDMVYSSRVVAQLQSVIDEIEKSIQKDRKDIDKMLTDEQERFAKTAPAVAKLPAEQRLLAAEIGERLKNVTEKRKAFTAASEKAEAEQAAIEAEQKENAANLQIAIRARRQIAEAALREQMAKLNDAERQKRIEAENAELAKRLTTEKAAVASLEQATEELAKAKQHINTWRATADERGRKEEAQRELDEEIKKINLAIRPLQIEMGSIVIPETNIEMQSSTDADKRPLYAGIAAGAVFTLLLIPIIWNLRLVSRDAHPHAPKLATLTPTNGFEPVLPRSAEISAEAPADAKAESEDALAAEPVTAGR